jgi:Ca2+-binding RTX toxin-like protein
MRGRLRWLIAFAASAFVAFVVVAVAHTSVQAGGGGNDTMEGHDHSDWLYGNSGCDDLLGRGGADHLEGGPSGCDKVRGMEGGGDDVIVSDDGLGNDEAYGGSGSLDRCYVGNKDVVDWSSCEVVVGQ